MVSLRNYISKWHTRFAEIGWLVLFAYISLIPFYYLQPVQLLPSHGKFPIAKYFPLVLIFIFLFIALFALNKRPFVLPKPALNIVVGFHLGIGFLSLIGAEYFNIGLQKWVYYVLSGVFIPFLLVNQLHQAKSVQRIVQGMVVITAVVAFYGIVVYVFQKDYIWGAYHAAYNPYYSYGRAASTLGNAVFNGAFLALGLPFGLWAHTCAKNPKQKRIFATLCGVIVLGLFFTFTRGAWISAGVGATIYMWPRLIAVKTYLKRALSWYRFFVCGLVFLLALSVLEGIGFRSIISQTGHLFVDRMEQLFQVQESESSSFRLAQYGTTWRILQTHPFLGVGFGNFTRLFEVFKHPDTPAAMSITTENMYLMVVCEQGVIGLVAFWALLAVFVRKIYLVYRVYPNGENGHLTLAFLASILGFVLNMATWDALNQPTVRMTFWMCIGLALCQMRAVLDDQKVKKRSV